MNPMRNAVMKRCRFLMAMLIAMLLMTLSLTMTGQTAQAEQAGQGENVEVSVQTDQAEQAGQGENVEVSVQTDQAEQAGQNGNVDVSAQNVQADENHLSDLTALLSGGKVSEIISRGVLRVGTAGDYQPMSYLDPETQTYVGFDTELTEDLAASLGVKIKYVPTSWPTLMEDTLAGKFDLAVCGITVTEERKTQALMSDGYFENGKTVLCRKEDAERYTSLEAINKPEVRVMENPGGLNEKFVRENLPDVTLIIHKINQEIPGLVAAGEADVMITEVMEAGYYTRQDSRLAAPLIDQPFTHGQLGFMMPKGSDDLLEYVNAFIRREKESGRIDELARKYFYPSTEEEALPDAA